MGEAGQSFLICGLGSLGQSCVSVLKEFGVTVNAIEEVEPRHWEIPNLPSLLDKLLIGDCRQPAILEQAGIHRCRAIMLLTSDERVNIAAAFAARSLNPNVRLVVRSAQDNLNELLGQQLGNFVAFEATQLPAPSFALAALDSETQGLFTLDHQRLRVSTTRIGANHPWRDRRQLHELNTPTRRLLRHSGAVIATEATPSNSFYRWEPDAKVQAGDTLSYIEITETLANRSTQAKTRRKLWQEMTRNLDWQTLRQTLNQAWQESTQTQRVAVLSSFVMLGLLIAGVILYKLQYPNITLQDAFNIAIVLMMGGFDNLFGQLKLPFPIPWWLHLFSLSVTVAGTIFIGILYAILTERVLASRFQFSRRLPIPQTEHVVLIGLGRIGQRVGTLLQEMKQPLVGIHTSTIDAAVLPQIPLITGSLKDALSKANLETAKSVVVVTDDEVTNLEIGLMARAQNPDCNLVIRIFDPRFGENVAQLLLNARVLGAYALAAAAFVGAAFGENILNLFRLNNRTALVTEYRIEQTDSLNKKLLAEIAYGYGVVPILHQKAGDGLAKLMPSDDVRLQVGDRLIVLATITGLQRVERGTMYPKKWSVHIEKALSEQAEFEGSSAIARISGCELATARVLISQLPQTLPLSLHKHQAQRLVRELGKVQVMAQLVRAA